MKRALVEYSSEDEEAPANRPPEQKKRQLPALSPSLTIPVPMDNPALHQGRVRTVPHVEGQYATYIYVPLVMHTRDPLSTLVADALTVAEGLVPSLHSIGRLEHDGSRDIRWELHISLSRPLFLRAHQREEFKRAIKQVASSLAPFDASFTTFTELMNDERTRSFLALELGAGHEELRRCLGLLGPTLRSLRLKEFYVEPRFHASIAWALLEKIPSPPNTTPLPTAETLNLIALPECTTSDEPRTRPASPRIRKESSGAHRITRFPPTLIPSLNETYAARLSQARTGGFVVDKISVKIGKDVFTWSLGGVK